MNLEHLTVKVRPRPAWEAIDLGFLLARNYWLKIIIPWLILLLPTVVTVTWLFSRWPSVSAFIIWWLKPLYDRHLLGMFSRMLFNDIPDTEESVRNIPKLFSMQLFSALTIHRLWLCRSFYLPVTQLEKLRGKEHKNRSNILAGNDSGNASWLTFGCLMFEAIVWMAIIGFIYLFLPSQYQTSFGEYMFFSENADLTQIMIVNLIYGLGILAIEPFYVAAGFMLYINRRAHLEAWDVELNFRKIGQRIDAFIKGGSTLALCLVLATSTLTISNSAFAATDEFPEEEIATSKKDQDQARITIEKIFQREEMGRTETVRELKYIGDPADREQKSYFDFSHLRGIFVYFAKVFKALLILALLIAIIMLILNREKWLPMLGIGQKQQKSAAAVETLFGMDLRPESLPQDIGASAKTLVEKNDIRGALSLLYRGALSVLINKDMLKVNEGHTESEILSIARPKLNDQRKSYLGQLTSQWILTAYGHKTSPSELALQLCDHWPKFEHSKNEH